MKIELKTDADDSTVIKGDTVEANYLAERMLEVFKPLADGHTNGDVFIAFALLTAGVMDTVVEKGQEREGLAIFHGFVTAKLLEMRGLLEKKDD